MALLGRRRVVGSVTASSGRQTECRGGLSEDSYLEVGSISKVFTGTLFSSLCAAGVVSPDDPISDLVGRPTLPITLAHLASHRSGLPRLPPNLKVSSDPYREYTLERLQEDIRRLPDLVVAPAGEVEEYSNFGYAVLGFALSKAAGLDYLTALRTHVLNPLSIQDVADRQPPGPHPTARSWRGAPRKPWDMTGAMLPAGGLWVTTVAMTTFVQSVVLAERLGPPAVTWQRIGPLLWHNGGTRDAHSFVAASPEKNRWGFTHFIGGSAEAAEQATTAYLQASPS